jgi:hypothetical protein
MFMQFHDNEREPQSNENVFIEKLIALPYPDGYRILVELQMTPFEECPNLLLTVHDDNDLLVSELDVFEVVSDVIDFTLHLRDVDDPTGVYSLTVELFYESKNPPQDHRIVGFSVDGVNLENEEQ